MIHDTQDTVDGTQWPTTSPEAAGLSPARLHALERALADGAFPKTDSVVVARQSQLVYEWYGRGTAPATLRNTRSVTKTVTSMLIGIAIDQGYLADVSVPIVSLLDDWLPVAHPDPRKAAITLEDFLTMSSALACNDNDPDSPGNEERMYPLPDYVRFTLDLPVRPLDGPAVTGERIFSYCTAGVATLGGVLERATGASVPDFAVRYLFDPLGIQSLTWQFSPSGLAMTGGGLCLTSRDLLKVGQLYLDGGRWQGVRVVSEDWIRASTRTHAQVDAHTAYGYLWWLRPFAGADAWLMSGNGGNKVAVFPSLQLVVVITSTNYNTPGMHLLTDRLLCDYILPAITT